MAILKDFQADALRVRVSDSREAMGRYAARAAGSASGRCCAKGTR